MKKLFVLTLAVVMIAAFAVPASALENKFGGFFETNWVTYKSLNYRDNAAADYSTVRNRTRLYYTAILSENLSFINQFEMDSEWGEDGSNKYGDLGADGIAVEVKRSYVDFTTFQSRFEIGVQNFNILRGLLVNDDAAGMKVSYRGFDGFIPAIWWLRPFNGDAMVSDNGQDFDHYTALVNIQRSNWQLAPSIGYLTTNNGASFPDNGAGSDHRRIGQQAGQATNIYVLGVDFNMKTDLLDIVAAAGYEGGEISDSEDISAYMLNAKVKVKLGKFAINAEALYTSGEEVNSAGQRSGDYDGWWYPEQNGTGGNYSTAEFYRKGTDWTKVPSGPAVPAGGFNNAPNGNAIENRMEFNLGAEVALSKTWKFSFDWWNLNLAEDAANGNSDIGNEFDLVATWAVMKNLKLELCGAYLLVGDAIKPTIDDNDAYEAFARLSLSF